MLNEVVLCKMSNRGSSRNGGLASVVPLRLRGTLDKVDLHSFSSETEQGTYGKDMGRKKLGRHGKSDRKGEPRERLT